jgi:hypothetical protein
MSDPAPPAGVYGCVQTRGFLPWLVRTVTRSWANHVFIAIGDGRIVEAEPGGVRIRDASEYAGCRIEYNDVEPMTADQRAAVAGFAENLIGEAYDWTADGIDGLVALGIRWRILGLIPKARRSVMCSELAARAGRSAGLDWLCGQTIAAQVTPGMLAQRVDEQVWT